MRKILALSFVATLALSACGHAKDDDQRTSCDRDSYGCQQTTTTTTTTTTSQYQNVPVNQYIPPQQYVPIYQQNAYPVVPQYQTVDVAIMVGNSWFVDVLFGGFRNRIEIEVGRQYYSDPCGCYYDTNYLNQRRSYR